MFRIHFYELSHLPLVYLNASLQVIIKCIQLGLCDSVSVDVSVKNKDLVVRGVCLVYVC